MLLHLHVHEFKATTTSSDSLGHGARDNFPASIAVRLAVEPPRNMRAWDAAKRERAFFEYKQFGQNGFGHKSSGLHAQR